MDLHDTPRLDHDTPRPPRHIHITPDHIYAFASGLLLGIMIASTFAIAYAVTTTIGLGDE